ncbi:hypothetical protein BH23BAC4_BH23BAC4_01550 [soil metagenome]
MRLSRLLLSAGLLCLLLPEAAAGDRAYAVDDRTRSLADGSPVLTRLNQQILRVTSAGRATLEQSLVQTVFSAAGREEAGQFGIYYDDFRRVRAFEGILRDSEGRVIHRVALRDSRDAAISTFSLYDGLRYRHAEIYSDRYPYTVEWRTEVEHRGLIGWPSWYAQPFGRPLESGSYTVIVPAGTAVRHRTQHIQVEPLISTAQTQDRYVWSVTTMPAQTSEPFAPAVRDRVPAVFVVGNEFEIGGSPGRLDSWEAFAEWYGGLSIGRDGLPAEAQREVEQIVVGAETDREKAERLYAHLQRTTRYVSIQLGLGGWQPFDAAYVFRQRYGDCKALTNYLYAMLRHVGVESFPALIYSGDGDPLVDDFPDNVFNHVVLNVPLPEQEGGSVWLECTSPFHGFGYLGASNQGRRALLVTAEGGRLVRTPDSSPDENRVERLITIEVAASGNADAEATWSFTGERRARTAAVLTSASAADREAWLNAALGMTGPRVMNLTTESLDRREPLLK